MGILIVYFNRSKWDHLLQWFRLELTFTLRIKLIRNYRNLCGKDNNLRFKSVYKCAVFMDILYGGMKNGKGEKSIKKSLEEGGS